MLGQSLAGLDAREFQRSSSSPYFSVSFAEHPSVKHVLRHLQMHYAVMHKTARNRATGKPSPENDMNVNVQVRMDPEMRDQANLVLKGIGMNLSDAVRFMAARIIEDKQLPFEVLRKPSAETLAAMQELEQRKGKRLKTVKDLMDDLNEDD